MGRASFGLAESGAKDQVRLKKKLRGSDLPHLLLKLTPYHRAMAMPLNRMPQHTVGLQRVARFGRAGQLWQAVASVLNS